MIIKSALNYNEEQCLEVKEEWLKNFANWMKAENKSLQTIKAYLCDIHSFAAWFKEVNGQELEPRLITSIDLQAYRTWQIEEIQVKPKTWNRRRASLSILVDWCMTVNYLNYDPMSNIEGIEEIELPPRWLDKKEYHAFMRQVEVDVNEARSDYEKWQTTRDRAMIYLMVYAGLREGEVVGLTCYDVEINDRSGRVIIRNGKGEKRRELPLSKETRKAMKQWFEIAGCHEGQDHLFIGKGGDPLGTRAIQRRVMEIGKEAGVEVSPHDLRHTFAKRMLDTGTPLTVVSKLLGHSRLDTTARYVQPGWGDYERAVEKI